MTEEDFKNQYIINFLASFAANRFKRDFPEGNISNFYKEQPIKEAIILADHAWKSYLKEINKW